jgi:hypothetical protein
MAKTLSTLRRVIEAYAPERIVDLLERRVLARLEKEEDPEVYVPVTKLAAFLAERRLIREELTEAKSLIVLLCRHRDPGNHPGRLQMAQAEGLALERVVSGPGFTTLTPAIRNGNEKALELLECMGPATALFVIREIKNAGEPNERSRFTKLLASLGGKAGEQLVAELRKTSTVHDILNLVEALPQVLPAETAEDALIDMLLHAEPAVRRKVISTLVKGTQPRTAPALLSAFQAEKDSGLKRDLLEALGILRFRNALATLKTIAEDKNASHVLRVTACIAMGRIGDGKSVSTLIRLGPKGSGVFRTVPSAVRSAATQALGLFPDNPEAVAALKQARSHKDETVRLSADKLLLAPILEAFPGRAGKAKLATKPELLGRGDDVAGGVMAELGQGRILEALGRNEATGSLSFTSTAGEGMIFLDSGVIIAAQAGGAKDKDAVRVLFQADDGFILYEPGVAPPERRVLLPVDALVAEFDR